MFTFSVGLQATAAVTEATPTAGSAEEIRAFIRANPGSLVLPQAVTGLYEKLAKNNISELTDFIEEFSDFPDTVARAKAARKKLSGLESRHAFRHGKIGEQYVPSFSKDRYSTQTYSINGETYTETKMTGSDKYGGYSTDRMGYTAVYQLFNESKQSYVVKIKLSGTSSLSEIYVKDSWGGEAHDTRSGNKVLTKYISYILDADSEFKDQVVVGETQPTDFEIEFVDIVPVSAAWAAGLRKALDGKGDLRLIESYLTDSRARAWHENLSARFAETARNKITVQLATGKRFDPDFESPVTATFINRTGMPLQIDFKPNFGTGKSLMLNVDKPQVEVIMAQSVSEDKLRVELTKIKSQTPRVESMVKPANVYTQNLAARQAARVQRAEEQRKAEQRVALAKAEEERRVALARALEPPMVAIPAGSFTMGSPSSDSQRGSDEGPQRRVIVAAFEMAKHEVTFNEWDACVADGGCTYKPVDKGWGRGQRPVIEVSWDDAQQYLAWLNKKTGKAYRLPSEAEWEYAARAGTTTRFHTGDCITTDQANFNGNNPANGCRKGEYRLQTLPVGSLAANAWGLYDMHGNVWEWTQDCWNRSYSGAPSEGSARSDGDCSRRAVRGSSWGWNGHGARSAYRNNTTRDTRRFDNVGFRLSRFR